MGEERDDWIAMSAAGLVVGAMALFTATAVSPVADSASEALMAVEDQAGRWLAGAVAFLLAAAGLTLGVPALLAGAPAAGRHVVQAGVALLCIGFTGLAGFAFLLVFLRSLVVADSLSGAELVAATEEAGLTAFLYTWLAAFFVGEVLLAVGLLRAGAAAVPRWIPVLLLLHVAGLGLAAGHDWGPPVVTSLVSLALCGLGIRVAQHAEVS